MSRPSLRWSGLLASLVLTAGCTMEPTTGDWAYTYTEEPGTWTLVRRKDGARRRPAANEEQPEEERPAAPARPAPPPPQARRTPDQRRATAAGLRRSAEQARMLGDEGQARSYEEQAAREEALANAGQ